MDKAAKIWIYFRTGSRRNEEISKNPNQRKAAIGLRRLGEGDRRKRAGANRGYVSRRSADLLKNRGWEGFYT